MTQRQEAQALLCSSLTEQTPVISFPFLADSLGVLGCGGKRSRPHLGGLILQRAGSLLGDHRLGHINIRYTAPGAVG